MVEEFIELIDLGVIKLPFEYGGQDVINIIKQNDAGEEFEAYQLSDEEKLSLAQIDLMKNEITSIHRTRNPEGTSVTYALSKEKESRMHDDRFYTIIMLAHRLYELRRGQIVSKPKDTTASPLFAFRKPTLLTSR